MRYDVAIVGAGPAGASCAYTLEKKGYNIVILDKEKFPRDKPCAGVLPPRIYSELDIPEDIIERPLLGYRIFSPAGEIVESAFPKKGLIVRRDTFDDYLVSRLNTKLQHNRATDIHVNKDFVTVKCTKGDVRAQIVVGSDGAHSVVRKTLNESSPKKREQLKDMAIAIQNEISISKEKIDERWGNWFEVYYTIPYGYGWISPLKDSVKVGIGGLSEDIKRESKKYLEEFCNRDNIKERIADGKVVSTGAHLIPMQGPFEILAGARALLCGDAGGFVFPGTGEGVYYAVKSGRVAAEVVDYAFGEGRFDSEFLEGIYNEKLEKNGLTALRDVDFVEKVLSSPEKAERYVRTLGKLGVR